MPASAFTRPPLPMPSRLPRPLTPAALALLLGGLLALPSTVAAQQPDRRAALRACFDAIPDTLLTRVPVYVEVTADGSGAELGLAAMDDLLGRAAERVRARLGGAATRLPHSEPVVTWRTDDGSLDVVLLRDGRVSWRVAPASAGTDTLLWRRPPAVELVGRALDELMEAGVRAEWPAGTVGDSLRYTVALPRVSVSPDGEHHTPPIRFGTPIYSLAVPPESPVVIVRQPRVAYPMPPQGNLAEGTVILRYVVDAEGRVAPESIEEQWPADRRRLTGELGRYYDRFLAAARRGVPTGKFEPARIGGCAVPRQVQQPVIFGVRR